MLYVNTAETNENPTYKAQAAATNHTITYSGETKKRVTKDTSNGAFSNVIRQIFLNFSCFFSQIYYIFLVFSQTFCFSPRCL